MNVEAGFFNHWKTQQLMDALNDTSAPIYVLRLWAHCEDRRRTTFDNLSAEALKTLCRYKGNANKLVAALEASRFIRLDDGKLTVLNFEEYNADLVKQWKKDEPKPPKEPKGKEYHKSFEEWYAAYPRHIGKEDAARAYAKAGVRVKESKKLDSVSAAAYLLEKALLFAQSETGKSEFCPHPATWLNRGSYDDDPKDWQRKNASGPKPRQRALIPKVSEMEGVDD